MNKWKPKLKLLSVLATTKELLLRSTNNGWPDEQPKQIAAEIDGVISHFLNPEQCSLPEFALVLYAPTGPVQEIAMANGWHDAYLALSSEYDKLEHLIKTPKTKDAKKKNG